MHVSDGHLSVVERRENVRDADGNILGMLRLDDFLGIDVFTKQFGSSRRSRGDRASGFSLSCINDSSTGCGLGLLGLGFVGGFCGFLRSSVGFRFLSGSGFFLDLFSHTKSVMLLYCVIVKSGFRRAQRLDQGTMTASVRSGEP